jgi:hypothetical protein
MNDDRKKADSVRRPRLDGLRDPKAWVIAVLAAACAGLVWEALGALLGDGHFDINRGLNNAVPALVGAVTVLYYNGREP